MFSRTVLCICTLLGLSLPTGTARADDAAEAKKLREQVDVLLKLVEERDAQLAKLRQELELAKREAVANDVKSRALQERCERLLHEVERVTAVADPQRSREVTNSARGLVVGGVQAVPLGSAAPLGVHGKVVAVGEGNLMEIDVGADAGLQQGNVLEVFRLVPENPKASAYLGRLTIVRVQPKQSVGRYESASSARDKMPRIGDSVSTMVGGNR